MTPREKKAALAEYVRLHPRPGPGRPIRPGESVAVWEIGEDAYARRFKAVARKLRKLTGCSIEKAEELTPSVVGCVQHVDLEGNLIFRSPSGAEVIRLPEKEFARALR